MPTVFRDTIIPFEITNDVFRWRLELRNKAFTLVDIFEPDNEASNIRWEYRRIGGCGTLRFKLSRPYDAKGDIDGTYDVQLLISNRATGNYDLWYRGLIQQMLVFKGRMYLIGGGTYTTTDVPVRVYFQEVWS